MRDLRKSDALVAVLLSLVILGPAVLTGGYVLRGDMVFVPDQPWKSAWLGLDGGVPRAVPMDAIVWIFGQVLPGDIVQKLLLTGSLIVLALGVARLLRGIGAVGRAAAMTFACWNPWVFERLAIGQWATVLGLAALPWLLSAVVECRRGATAGWLLLAAVAAPSMGLTAVVVAVAVAATQRTSRSDWLLLGAACIATNLPWIVPSLLRSGLDAPPGQFAGFAATAESGAGTLASVLSLGGIWKISVVPAERTTGVVVGAAAVLSLVAVAVLHERRRDLAGANGLLIAAALSFVLAALPLSDALGDLARSVPALGILRDSTRYLAPLVLVVALGFGLLVHEVVSRARAAVLVALLPVALLPSMAWGLHGFLEPTHYPSSWYQARAVMQREGADITVVLPWRGSYRGFSWTDGHAVLDPAPRFFPGDVLVDDRTFLSDRVIASEDPYLQRIDSALSSNASATALRALGVRWVLVEPGPRLPTGQLPSGSTAFTSADLTLIDLGTPASSTRTRPPVGWVIAADFAALLPFFLVCLRKCVTGVTVRSN
jgi:hypothetical protein